MSVRFTGWIAASLWLCAGAASPQSPPTQVMPALQDREPVGPIPGPPRERKVLVNPFRNDAGALRDGRQLFLSFNCAGCHGDHAGGGMGPSLRDEDWIYGGEAIDIFDSISEGRAHGMPAWGTMLPPQYVWQLVTYIQSLRTPQEPDTPE